MKKRLKLFSTIASLCLAVALMAFGVWAATTANFGVSSTVKYTVSGQVNVEITIKVTYDMAQVKGTLDGASTAATGAKYQYTAPTGTGAVSQTWVVKQGITDGDVNLTNSDLLKLGAYEFNIGAVNNSTVVYEIKIENKGQYDATVTITDAPKDITTSSSITVATLLGESAFNSATPTNIEAGKSVTLKTTYTLVDNTKDCAELTYNPSFKIGPKA